MAPPMPHVDCNASTLAATLTLTAGCAGLQRVEAEWQARHEWGGVRVHAMLLDLSGAAQLACQPGSLCMQRCRDLSGLGTVDCQERACACPAAKPQGLARVICSRCVVHASSAGAAQYMLQWDC